MNSAEFLLNIVHKIDLQGYSNSKFAVKIQKIVEFKLVDAMKARREVATIAQHATEPSDSHGPCDRGPSCEGRGGHTTLPPNSQRGHKNETPFNRFKTGVRGTPGAQLHTRKRPCGRFIRKICSKIKLIFLKFQTDLHARRIYCIMGRYV